LNSRTSKLSSLKYLINGPLRITLVAGMISSIKFQDDKDLARQKTYGYKYSAKNPNIHDYLVFVFRFFVQ
jgi:hypothetical protein